MTKSFTDQALERELKGTAMREPNGLKVEIDKPEKNSLELRKTQFPTQHLVELIDKANTGETFYETNLFDGSENGDKVMTTTVIVGKKADAAASDPGTAGARQALQGQILAGRYRLFRRGQ